MKSLVPLLLTVSTLFAGHWFNNEALQESLDIRTHSVGRTGNRVELLQTGAESLEKRLKNATTAKVIFVKTFEFWNDLSGTKILNLLTARAKEGAKVFVAYDVKGLPPDLRVMPNENPIPPYLMKFLQESGGNGFVIPTSIPYSIWTDNIFSIPLDHEKYFITWDGQGSVEVVMGGMNTGDMYLLSGAKNAQGKPFEVAFYQSEGFSGRKAYPLRDTDIELKGTATQDVVERYIQSCEFQVRNPNPYFQSHLAEGIRHAIREMRAIQNQMKARPKDSFPENVGDAFVRLITKSAQSFGIRSPLNIQVFFEEVLKQIPQDSVVRFATAYFLPTKILWRSIYRAAERGVHFDILLNIADGPEPTIAIISLAARPQMLHFLKTMPPEQIRFFEWAGAASSGTSMMHQKVYSFGDTDEDPFCIGSSNLTAASLFWNSEDVLVIQSPSVKRQLRAMLQSDFSPPNSQEILMRTLKQQPRGSILKGVLLNKFFKDFL